MRLINPISVKGNFWMPSVPDGRIPSELKIKDGGIIRLELYDRGQSGLRRPLWLLCQKMELLFQLYLLKEPGFDITKVKEMATAGHQLSYKF